MGNINKTLPDLFAHFDLEIVDVERAQLNNFVMNLVVTLSWYLNLHGEVFYFDSFDAAWNKPQARSFANNWRVNVDTAYSQHKSVGSVFEGEVFDCESINAVSVDGFELNVVHVQEALLFVVDFEGFVLEDFVCCEGCRQLQNVVQRSDW